jgi:hypothetical protein
MVLNLAERLEVPLRERNVLLVAAGYAPIFPERTLDDPALQAARRAVDLVLAGHEPYPALAVDRHWTLIAHNRAVMPLLAGADASLLKPPVNVLRLALHPQGLAPRIANLREWRAHLLERLQRQVAITADDRLAELYAELSEYPGETAEVHAPGGEIAVPLRWDAGDRELAFFSTIATFGTAVDITLAELAIEAFFPADRATADYLLGN